MVAERIPPPVQQDSSQDSREFDLQSAKSGKLARLAAIPHRWLIAVLVVGTLALRSAWINPLPVNWDAVQLALGSVQFDLAVHQPHPPGYLLFVLTGSLLNGFTGSGAISLSLVSWLAGGLALMPTYALGRLSLGPRAALLGTTFLATSPLAWFYGSVGLTYAAEGLFGALVAWQLWRSQQGSAGALRIAALALAIGGGVRPWTIPFMLPAFLWVAASRPAREVVGAVMVFGLACAAWLLPLLDLAGGLTAYLKMNADLASVVAPLTSVLGGPFAVIENVSQVVLTLFLGLHVGVALLVPAMLRGKRRFRFGVSAKGRDITLDELRVLGPSPIPSEAGRFFALLILPALAFYTVVHLGQPGYHVLILGPLCLLAGRVADWVAIGLSVERGIPTLQSRAVIGGIVTACGVALFLWHSSPITGNGLVKDRLFWSAVRSDIAASPAETTLILTGPGASESARLAMYLFPDRDIRAIGRQSDGFIGAAYHNVGGRPSRTFSELASVASFDRIVPPSSAQRIVLLDPAAVAGIQSIPEIMAIGPVKEVTVVGSRSYWSIDRAP